jgi:hypothetical protein
MMARTTTILGLTVQEALDATSLAVIPILPRQVAVCGKSVSEKRPEDFNDEDLAILERVFSSLLPSELEALKTGATFNANMWPFYLDLFTRSSHKPAWDLVPMFRGGEQWPDHLISKQVVKEGHFKFLLESVKAGRIVLRNTLGVPISPNEIGSYNEARINQCNLAPIEFKKFKDLLSIEDVPVVSPINDFTPQMFKDAMHALAVQKHDDFVKALPTIQDQQMAPTDQTKALPPTTPVPRQTAQENFILEAIKTLGYNATRLPKNQGTRPGVKAKVRAQAKGEVKLFTGSTVFDKAWIRCNLKYEE